MRERTRRYEPYALILAVCAMLFCAFAQLVLSWVPFFGPNRGEIPEPAALAITAVSVGALVVAARKDGLLLKLKPFLWGVAALSWLAFFVMLGLSLESPWELTHVSMWQGGSEHRNFVRGGIWRPLHALHALGPITLVLVASAREQPRARRMQAVLSGVVPWLLGSALYAYLLSLSPPIFLG